MANFFMAFPSRFWSGGNVTGGGWVHAAVIFS